MSTTRPNLARALFMALLAAAAFGVSFDTYQSLQQGEISALRTQESVEDDSSGSVDAFCGFAPCGMPLECN